jgi:hypothetical protein
MKQLATLSEKFIAYVRNAIDFTVSQEGGQYPVMGSVITASGIATERQLDKLEEAGHIKSFEVQVPSTLMPNKTVKMKAYYTERLVPTYVKA